MDYRLLIGIAGMLSLSFIPIKLLLIGGYIFWILISLIYIKDYIEG